MSGPIRNLLSTMQEKKPVRNAIRGLFGLDPLEEMAAREREIGTDISNPFPPTRPAMGSKPPSQFQQVSDSQPVDEMQPLKGKGLMEAVFAPQPKPVAQEPAAAPAMAPKNLQEELQAIESMQGLTDIDRAKMVAAAFTRASLSGTKEQREQFAKMAQQAEMSQMFHLTRQDEQNVIAQEREWAKTEAERLKKEQEEAAYRLSPAYRQEQLRKFLQDPGMSPEIAAATLTNDAQMQLSAEGSVMSAEDFARMRDSLTRTGYAIRAHEYVVRAATPGSEVFFTPGHPGFRPMADYYRRLAKATKDTAATAQQMRADLEQAVVSAVLKNANGDEEDSLAEASMLIESIISNTFTEEALRNTPNPPANAAPTPQQPMTQPQPMRQTSWTDYLPDVGAFTGAR